jgi:hypothetical protein
MLDTATAVPPRPGSECGPGRDARIGPIDAYGLSRTDSETFSTERDLLLDRRENWAYVFGGELALDGASASHRQLLHAGGTVARLVGGPGDRRGSGYMKAVSNDG